MILLDKLIVSNFLTFGQDVVIPLNLPGITTIIGRKDADSGQSNGAGKSSVASAISYAFWGVTLNKRKADRVVNRFAKHNCSVELFWTEGEDAYSIRRTRKWKGTHKPADLELFKNGASIASSTNGLTQETIDRAIGMSFNTFLTLVPGAIKLAELDDAELKGILEGILGTDRYAKACERAKESVRVLKKSAEALQGQVAAVDAELARYRALLTSAQADQDNWSRARVDAECVLERELAAAQEAVAILSQHEPPVPEPLSTAAPGIDKAWSKLYSECVSARAALEKQLVGKQSQITTELRMLTDQVTRLHATKECPTCLSKMEHKGDVVEQLNKRIATLTVQLRKLTEKASLVLQKKQDEIDEARQQVELGASIAAAAAREHTAQATARASWESDVRLKTYQVQHIEQRLAHERLTKHNPFVERCKSLQTTITERTEARAALQEQLNSTQSSLTMAQFWVDGFGIKGVRARLLDAVIPFMNSKAALYTSLLSEHLKVQFSTATTLKSGKTVDAFTVGLTMDDGGESWDDFSTGERARAAVVMSLVFGDVAALRASKKLSLFLLDEVLDSIDVAGSASALDLLVHLRDRYPSIYLITHKSDLQSMITNTLTISKANGYSTCLVSPTA